MKMELSGLSALQKGLDLDMQSLMPEAIDSAMPILVEATRNAIRESIRHPDQSTGELVGSVTAKKAKELRSGDFYASVDFIGTGSNGTRNALKAAEMEYGNSAQAAAPFADRAVHAAQSAVHAAIEDFIAKRTKL